MLVLLVTDGVLAAQAALWLAPVVIVGRLALTGLVKERLSGRPASSAALWGGVALAVVSAVIAVAKTLLTR